MVIIFLNAFVLQMHSIRVCHSKHHQKYTQKTQKPMNIIYIKFVSVTIKIINKTRRVSTRGVMFISETIFLSPVDLIIFQSPTISKLKMI